MLFTRKLKNEEGVIHVIAEKVYDASAWLADLTPTRRRRMSALIERGRFFH